MQQALHRQAVILSRCMADQCGIQHLMFEMLVLVHFAIYNGVGYKIGIHGVSVCCAVCAVCLLQEEPALLWAY